MGPNQLFQLDIYLADHANGICRHNVAEIRIFLLSTENMSKNVVCVSGKFWSRDLKSFVITMHVKADEN